MCLCVDRFADNLFSTKKQCITVFNKRPYLINFNLIFVDSFNGIN